MQRSSTATNLLWQAQKKSLTKIVRLLFCFYARLHQLDDGHLSGIAAAGTHANQRT